MQIIVDHEANARRPGGVRYALKEDVVAGFKDAVANNQPTLALEYLRFIVDEVLVRVSEPVANATNNGASNVDEALTQRVAELESTVEALKAGLATSRKTTRAKADVEQPE